MLIMEGPFPLALTLTNFIFTWAIIYGGLRSEVPSYCVISFTNSETGGIGDVSGGTSRRLMIAQGQGGKLMYAAPEIISKEVSVDAFATDLWSVGVVLFVMLVGLAPFKWAHPTDKRFANISMGGLKNVIKAL